MNAWCSVGYREELSVCVSVSSQFVQLLPILSHCDTADGAFLAADLDSPQPAHGCNRHRK